MKEVTDPNGPTSLRQSQYDSGLLTNDSSEQKIPPNNDHLFKPLPERNTLKDMGDGK
ncbi:hypothetical protein [Ruegeria arenilitoris]|uniref:hypothetical protein n=1 Tax=Ruegeria arenilitoris TaxID=1173585 RepID=UPI00147F57C8|nr:hypothetical protein [Ruegeria arenilitoris]